MREAVLFLLIHEANYLKKLSRYNIYFELWCESARSILEKIYGIESGELKQFNSIRYAQTGRGFFDSALCQAMHEDGLEQATTLLLGLIWKINPREHRLDMISDVRSYMKGLKLSKFNEEQIINELEELCAGIEKMDISQEGWEGEIKMNKVVKILHNLVGVYVNEKDKQK